MGKAHKTYRYQRTRAAMLAETPMCSHCSRRTATEADHQPPLSLHDHEEGTGCCVLIPSCGPCARAQGARLAGLTDASKVETVTVEEPEGFPVESSVWDVPWLEELRDLPANATWPRLMTVPHPRAVASLGPEVGRWAEERRGRPWRWWQSLAAARLFEVDADGRLCWELALLTLARQLGKTWWLGDICGWRTESDRFDGEQLVLSTGKDVAVCREMQRPSRVRAKQRRDTYRVREVNGQEEIEVLSSGSRWMVRAKESVYGITATMATVDEGWKVPASVVDDGIIATMVEQAETQLLLVSTAHRKTTALMVGRRTSAFAEMASGEGSLLIEWSAPCDLELDDRDGWRQASPHWTPKRERWIAERLAAAVAGESDDVDEPDPIAAFRTQWLNQWPAKRVIPSKGERLLDADEWSALAGPVESDGGRIWIGLEDYYGQGAAVAAAVRMEDGRIGLDGWTCESWDAAIADVQDLTKQHDRYRLMVGVTAMSRVPPGLRAIRHGSTETRTGLSVLRDLVSAGQVIHDDTPELDAQVNQARVTKAIVGLMLVAGSRSDLVRAASWAVQAAAKPIRVPSIA
jgi:hypothetical protein